MKKHRQILRLQHECGWPMRRIAKVVQVSVGTVHNVVTESRRAKLSWPLPADMDDARLEQVLGYYQKYSHIGLRQSMASDLAGASPCQVRLS